MMKRLVLVCVLWGLSLIAHGLEPTAQSVKIKAEKMIAPTKPDTRQRQTVRFLGHVRMTSGNLTLHSDTFTVLRQYDNIIMMQAVGNARLYDIVDKETAERLGIATGTELNARADTIRYSVAQKTVVFTGDAMMQWQGNLIRGDEIEFDLEGYQVISSTAEGGEPTEIILEPIGPRKPQVKKNNTIELQQPIPLPRFTPANKPVIDK